MQQRVNLLAASLIALMTSITAQAALFLETANGINLVYNSSSNTTWIQDANLLGSLEAGNANLINQIIAANKGVIHDMPNYLDGSYNNYASAPPYSGVYTLSAYDFNASGQGTADWFGAQAFVSYLNSIDYGGSSHWALPSIPDSYLSNGYNQTGSQLGELYYTELGLKSPFADNGNYQSNFGIFGNGTYGGQASVGPFSNVRSSAYWSGMEYSSTPSYAWIFSTLYGSQYSGGKNNQFYTWVVSSGEIAPVPLPSALWLNGVGVFGILCLMRRKVEFLVVVK